MAGRPRIYETVNTMQGEYLPDGHYTFDVVSKHLNRDFASEKEMCDFIEDRIEIFCAEVLGVTYKSHKREYRLASSRIHGSHSCRLDFFIITTDNQNICIECKNPFSQYENLSAIGQLLAYKQIGAMLEIPIHRMVLVTTKVDLLTTLSIRNTELGIELIGIDKAITVILKEAK